MKPQTARNYLLLHILMLLFSFSPVCAKLAGQHEMLSGWFILYYALVLLILFVYAVLWQQIIRRMPLSSAYANKAVTIIWGMLWGRMIFGEAITGVKLIGAAIILAGVLLYAKAAGEEADV